MEIKSSPIKTCKSVAEWQDVYLSNSVKNKEYEKLSKEPSILGVTLANDSVDELLQNKLKNNI